MRRKAPVILIILLFVAGICVLMYPFFSMWYNDRTQTTIVETYHEAVVKLEDKEITVLRESAESYNKGLRGNVVLTDPFDGEAADEISGYEELLNIEKDGVMGSVRIPEINVQLPVYHGTSAEVLKKGVGHLEKTSLPVGGIGTHAVLSTHTGYPTAMLFTDLDKLEEGNLFFLEVLGETLAYRVDQVKVVEPSDTSDLLIDSEEDYVTLVTCTPYGVNSHRLLVRGVRTDYVETEEMEEKGAEQMKQMLWRNWPYIVAGIILILFLAIYTIYRRRKMKRLQAVLHENHDDPALHITVAGKEVR